MKMTIPAVRTVLTINGREYTVRSAGFLGSRDRCVIAVVTGHRGAEFHLSVRLRPDDIEVRLDSRTATGHSRTVHFARTAFVPAGLDLLFA